MERRQNGERYAMATARALPRATASPLPMPRRVRSRERQVQLCARVPHAARHHAAAAACVAETPFSQNRET